MSNEAIGGIGVLALLILLGLGLRIGIALVLVGAVGLAVLISPDAALIRLGDIGFDTVFRYELGVLPLFLLMAHLCFQAGASRDFFAAAARLLGHWRGGLALAGVGACAGFGAISGSSLATVATIGTVALPEMRAAGYAPSLATGAIAAGGSIGSLVPPSAALIVFGILAEQSIGRLFTAAILPALTQAALYMITIALVCALRSGLGPPLPAASWRERLRALAGLRDIGLLIMVVIGGIAVGWFSPTEAASVGCMGALVLLLLRRQLTGASLATAIGETLRTAGMIYLVIIGALAFSTFIAAARLPAAIAGLINGLHAGPTGLLAVMVLMILALGTFLDGIALMTLITPIFLPIVHAAGISPIFFGVLLVRAMEVGFVHPPIGMNIYVIHGIAPDIPLTAIFRGILPFLAADAVHLGILIMLPESVLWLPHVLGSQTIREGNDMALPRPAHESGDPPAIDLGKLKSIIGFRLRRIQNHLARNLAGHPDFAGRKPGQLSALAVIAANPGLSQVALGDACGFDKAMTVMVVDELEASGWARRERAVADRRRNLLFVTPAGEEQLEHWTALALENEAPVRAALSSAELALLSDLLDRIYDRCLTRDAG